MKRLAIAFFAAVLATAAIAAEAGKLTDDTFRSMQSLYMAKTVLSQMIKGVDKAGGIGLVLKGEDGKVPPNPPVIWIDPKDPEWAVLTQAFKDAANRQANTAAEKLEKYKVEAPAEEKKPEAKPEGK
jgi:hypothetical protein